MEIQIASLCDAANDTNSALNMLGARDLFAVPRVPFQIPSITLVVRMSFTREDEGEHDLTISLLDPDGTPIVKPAEVNLNFQFPPEDLEHVSNNMVIPMHGLKFENGGTHLIDIRCDGEILVRRPISILVKPELAQQMGGPPPAAPQE